MHQRIALIIGLLAILNLSVLAKDFGWYTPEHTPEQLEFIQSLALESKGSSNTRVQQGEPVFLKVNAHMKTDEDGTFMLILEDGEAQQIRKILKE